MSLSYTVPSSLEYFACLVQSDEHFPLLEAAASIAQEVVEVMNNSQVRGAKVAVKINSQEAQPATGKKPFKSGKFK